MSLKENELTISDEIVQKSRSYFRDDLILPAAKLLKLGKICVSFSKKNEDHYYVVSGIVRDEKQFQVKIVYKGRLEGTDEGPISSRCDCLEWTSEEHCKHCVALYLGFHLQSNYSGTEQFPSLPLISSPYCATPNRYGTIIRGPHELATVPSTVPYSTLQYMLSNKRTINFPIPENFTGTLVLNINNLKNLNQNDITTYPEVIFSHIGTDNVNNEKITLFEGLYVFNWESGNLMHIPHSIRELLKIIVKDLTYPDINFINNTITSILSLSLKGTVKLVVDGTNICDMEKLDTTAHLYIANGKKRHHLHATIRFIDPTGTIAPVPTILQHLTFQNGLLGSFRKKTTAYEFLVNVKDAIETGDQIFKKTLIGNSYKSTLTDSLESFLGSPFIHQYDIHSGRMFKYDPIHIKKLITSIVNSFGPSFFRFAIHHHDLNEIVFEINHSLLFQGLSQFTYETAPYKILIYYDNDKTKSWTPSMRFERRGSAEKWFDLELNISDSDLEIIKNADIETGLSVSNSGMILLTKDQIELLKFIKRYTKGQDLDTLSNNKDETSINQDSEENSNKLRIAFTKARIFELFEMKKLGLDGALSQEEIDTCNRLRNLTNIPEYHLPPHLDSVMRPYQKVGHNWLQFLYENKMGACLADDMGLGKTLQVISLIETLYDKISRVLVVSPVSLLLNWENEINKFTNLKSYIYHGGGRVFSDDTKIILTSYGIMKKEYNKSLQGEHFDILILDEVQHLKNIRSLGAFAARNISADFKICVTGTPVENDLAEFYNIIDLGIPGIWGDLNLVRAVSNKQGREMAKKIAAPFILRRTKSNVLKDLPPKIQHDYLLTFDESERDQYNNTLAEIKKTILTTVSKNKYGEILTGLLRLRQRCLWNPNGPSSTKINFLIEQLDQIQTEGHQAIVFSQFTTYLDIIEKTIREKHWRTSRIDGSQNIKKRQEQLNLFQSGKNKIFLISLKAGGVGLNLTAASYVFIMDPWWNPAVENQAIDRAHRIGQANTLTVYRPIIKDSIEEKVLKLQDSKRELFNDLLPENDDNYFTGRLTMKDFEHLLTL